MTIYFPIVDLDNRGGFRIALHIIRELYVSLVKLNGIVCKEINVNDIDNIFFTEDDILVGFCVLIKNITNIEKKKCKMVLINTEPLYTKYESLIPFITTNVDILIEYNVLNTKILQKNGFTKFIFMPPTYAPIMEQIYTNNIVTENKTEKNIDVLFYGALTEYRQTFINKLKNKGLMITCVHAKNIELFNNYLYRSKIVLCIFNNPDINTFDFYRCSYLVSNGILVVHENFDTQNNKVLKLLKKNLIIRKRSKIYNTLVRLLHLSNKQRNELALKHKNFYVKKMNMVNYNILELLSLNCVVL